MKAIATTCLMVVVVLIGVSLITGVVLWLLWNAVVPPVFHGPILSYWQAVLLALLISVISNFFKSSSGSK